MLPVSAPQSRREVQALEAARLRAMPGETAVSDEQDAARYRWLKQEARFALVQIAWRYPDACVLDGSDADAVIDAAIKASGQPSELSDSFRDIREGLAKLK